MSSPAAPPPPPDPVATANAQTASNVKTATNQQELNMVDQYTPYGSLTYQQVSPWGSPSSGSPSPALPTAPGNGLMANGANALGPSMLGAGAASSSAGDGTPHFASVQTLSPDQQKLFNLNTQTQTNLGQIGVDQSNKVGQILNTPFNVNDAINTQLSDQATKLLDPVWNRRQTDTQAQLLNQGYAPDSEGYKNAMTDFNNQRNTAYDSAQLAGRSQAEQEALTNRNQPLNEISALLSGSQVSQPNFTNTPQANVAPTDVAGITQAGYQNALVPWQAQNQYNQALMGGLFGLGGAAAQGATLGMMKSDRRVKENITEVGRLSNGLPVYSFRYIEGGPQQIGLMADDVEAVMPEAVMEINGIKHVNYELATGPLQ